MTNTSRYTISYSKFVSERIPEALRIQPLPQWVMALISPVVYLYSLLLAFRLYVLYRLTITPQVCYLEKMLNDRYDTTERRIYIDDGAEFSKLYVYLKSELKPVYIHTKAEDFEPKTFLYRKGEVTTGGFDFVVFVPAVVAFDAVEIRALIDTYRLASKRNYIIQTF